MLWKSEGSVKMAYQQFSSGPAKKKLPAKSVGSCRQLLKFEL